MRIYRRKYMDRNGVEKTGKTWWVCFYVAGQRFHQSLRTRDKRAADLVAADMLRREELKRAGIVDPYGESHELPLKRHLADFEKTMRGRGVVEKYVKDRMGCLRKYAADVGAARLGDFTLPGASGFLSQMKGTGLSARSVNRYYQALRQLGLWLVKTRRMQFDPFDGLKPRNEAADRRHVRRALTPKEAVRLLDAARARPLRKAKEQRIHKGVTPEERLRLTALGEVRALVYAIALGTGLRKGEIRQLRWADVDLERREVQIPAAVAKSRRNQRVELAEATAAQLAAARPASAAPGDLVIPKHTFPTTRTFHADLVEAKIERKGEDERVVDFHALRTTYISWLALGGVHPRIAQHLARHASIETTMERYTDLSLIDVRGAVDGLPLPAAPKKKAGRPITQPRVWDRSGGRATG